MVRRRTRATKILAISPSTSGVAVVADPGGENEVTIGSIDLLDSNNFNGVVAAAVPNLEDQFFASPKRKDCKIDSIHVHNNENTDDVVVVSAVVASGNAEDDDKMFEIQKSKVSSLSPGKSRAERNSERTIGKLKFHIKSKEFVNFFFHSL